MTTSQHSGASSAPSPKILQAARIAGAGVSPSVALALADLFFPTTKRDDCRLLASVTADRVSASAMECC